MNSHSEKALFEQIGGTVAVNAAVDIFYTKVLADDTISHFFRWTHMRSQLAMQKDFLAYVFGGPQAYSGKNMREAHAHLVERGLNEHHFRTLMVHLAATLHELGVPEHLIVQVIAIAESNRHDVLGRQTSS